MSGAAERRGAVYEAQKNSWRAGRVHNAPTYDARAGNAVSLRTALAGLYRFGAQNRFVADPRPIEGNNI
jgi:hypothetical protein